MDVSFIIANWNTRELLLQCISAIDRLVRGIDYEIIVVDNGSSDGSKDAIQERFPAVRCIANSHNRGFGAANNQAFEVMQGRYAVLINTDATLKPGAIEALLAFMEKQPQAGMACGQLINADGSKQNSYAAFPSLLTLIFSESLLRLFWPTRFKSKNRSFDMPITIDSCIGACMIVRKEAIDQVGGFDERYFFFFEETDWAKRFWNQRWKVYFIPEACTFHAQGQTVGSGAYARKLFYYARMQYLRKWHPRQFGLFKTVIVARLLINVFFNFTAVLFTVGRNSAVQLRFTRYIKLVGWHLAGCPSPVQLNHARSDTAPAHAQTAST